jgi:glycosyltransferase involved in cell wall biosynthesis
MPRKLVSIIVPVFQGEAYLAEALDSIVAQNYRPIEIVVVDDGSTDDTPAIAKSYPDVKYVYQANQGHSVAKNTGLANASGELIAFLDADDYWAPAKLDIESRYLEAHPHLGGVMGQMHNFLDGIERPVWIPQKAIGEDGDALSLGACLLHRRLFDQIGHFNVDYWHGNDLDWFIRAREAGIELPILPDVFLYRRLHERNLSHDQNKLARERMRILKAHIGRLRSRNRAAVAAGSPPSHAG